MTDDRLVTIEEIRKAVPWLCWEADLLSWGGRNYGFMAYSRGGLTEISDSAPLLKDGAISAPLLKDSAIIYAVTSDLRRYAILCGIDHPVPGETTDERLANLSDTIRNSAQVRIENLQNKLDSWGVFLGVPND